MAPPDGTGPADAGGEAARTACVTADGTDITVTPSIWDAASLLFRLLDKADAKLEAAALSATRRMASTLTLAAVTVTEMSESGTPVPNARFWRIPWTFVEPGP